MASRYNLSTNQADTSKGYFSIAQAPDGWTTVTYEFSQDLIQSAKDLRATALAAASGIELLRVNRSKNLLTIFPVNTFPDRDDFLQSKYGQIQSILLEGFWIEDPQSPEDVEMILEELNDPRQSRGLISVSPSKGP